MKNTIEQVGYWAFFAGDAEADNPFDFHDKENHEAWRAGWKEALEDWNASFEEF
jgi:ribosome modulation factor